MAKVRLDQEVTRRKMTTSRSQAENWIKLGKIKVGGEIITNPGFFVRQDAEIKIKTEKQYVSRAGLKLASVVDNLGIKFTERVVLDVGSSTGGFTDYALQHGATRVFAVDIGTDQMSHTLRLDDRIELHEKTDIRDFVPSSAIDIAVMDVSFISLRDILPHIASLSSKSTQIVAMVKPQFEASTHQLNRGVIKNDSVRRQVLKEFESWAKQYFAVIDKKDSDITGSKGNRERFYLLRCL